MPSAAYMGMMMMMVSLSEQAKQPLSLPLPPKVFFTFFHPSHPVLLTLPPPCCEHCVPFTILISLHKLMFLIIPFSDIPIFFSFFFSLFLVQPLPSSDRVDIGIVIMVWSYGPTVFPGPCGVVTYNSFSAIGSEPYQVNFVRTDLSNTKGTYFQEKEQTFFPFQLSLAINMTNS